MYVNQSQIEDKREKAKKMYQHGMSVAEMAEVLSLPYEIPRLWSKHADFQDIQRIMQMRLSHMMRTLLLSFEDQQAGRTPTIKPTQLLQYATAYEKLSDHKKHVGCWYDAFEQLTELVLSEVEALRTKKAKMAAWRRLRTLRQQMGVALKGQAKVAFSE